jgi:hypothetical protein
MKITAKIAAMTLMTAMVGAAAEPKQPQQKLTVYLRENVRVPPEVRAPALDLANKMFATIGIRLEWRSGEPPRTSSTRPIGIELATDTPTNLLPGALGCACLTKVSTSECSTTAFRATSRPDQCCLPMWWSTKSLTFFKGPTSIPIAGS